MARPLFSSSDSVDSVLGVDVPTFRLLSSDSFSLSLLELLDEDELDEELDESFDEELLDEESSTTSALSKTGNAGIKSSLGHGAYLPLRMMLEMCAVNSI